MQRYTEVINYQDMENYFNKCTEPYWKRIAKGLYYTGARAGELIKIKQQDISTEEDGFVHIRIQTEKNPHAPIRYAPINPLKENIGSEVFLNCQTELIFPPYGKVKNSSYLRVMRKKFNEFWGVAPHYFRHCRLTHMVTEFDFNDQELVKYAGWTDSKPGKWYMSLKTKDLHKKMI